MALREREAESLHLKLSCDWLCIRKDGILCRLVCMCVTVCVFPEGVSVPCGDYS